MAKKLPAMPFYAGDWLKDPGLRVISKSAKGVWIDMLCLMWECSDRGVLSSGGRSWSDQQIAAAVGGDSGSVAGCLVELLEWGVAHRNSAGAVYCKRMVRDEEKRHKCSEAGSRGGGNPTFKGHPKGVPKGHPKGDTKRLPEDESESEYGSDFHLKGKRLVKICAEIYAHYPKKVGKAAALKAIEKALRLVTRGFLMDRAKAYAKAREGQDRQFTPHPATWFNQGRYDDDPAEWLRDESVTETKLGVVLPDSEREGFDPEVTR